MEKPKKNQWLNEPGCGENWWNRVRNEQIGGENWLKSHDKIKEWMGKMMNANDKMNK